MSTLTEWTRTARPRQLEAGEDGGQTATQIRAMAHGTEGRGSIGRRRARDYTIAAWSVDDRHWITVALFEWSWGEGEGARYSLVAYCSGCVAFLEEDEPMSELRHLHVGEDGYLNYPDVDALVWWLGVVKRVYAEAKADRYPEIGADVLPCG